MGRKILVVDDNEALVHFIKGLLEKNGHEVTTALDGLQALNHLASMVPDIIFIDLIMPKVDGNVLCNIIRKIPEFKNSYLVILSAAIVETESTDKTLFADRQIAKGPFDEMAKQILEAVEHSKTPWQTVENGDIAGCQTIYNRRITSELLSRNRHLETILNSVDEGIMEVFTSRIIFANTSAVAILGRPMEKLIGTELTNLFDGRNKSLVENLLSSPNEEPAEISRNAPLELDGRQVIMKKLPLHCHEDSMLFVIRDASEQIQLEMKLQHAQKMEAIGTMSTGIAHNFRNTLAAILVNSQLIQMKYPENKDLCEIVDRIITSVHQGTDLVERLLQFSDKNPKNHFQQIDIADIINEVSMIIGKSFDRNVNIHTYISDKLFVLGEYPDLSQVLLNLCNNARDAMPGGGKIFITGKKLKGKIIMEVADTGFGMSEEIASKCFDPFFTTKEMSKGTGLGLSTSYGIVKAHNGQIRVRSTPGMGTTFTVELHQSRREKINQATSAPNLHKGENEKVLVVDDDETMLAAIPGLLHGLGYRAAIASGPEAAMDIFREWRPAIVLMDSNMPGMDGFTCAERMKELDAHVQIAIVSGYTDGQEANKEGLIQAYLTKPVNVHDLSHLLTLMRS